MKTENNQKVLEINRLCKTWPNTLWKISGWGMERGAN